MSDWTGLRSPCGQDLSFDADRFIPFDFTDEPRPERRAPVPHEVHVGWEEQRAVGWRRIGWCSCGWESALYRSRSDAQAAALLHAAGSQ